MEWFAQVISASLLVVEGETFEVHFTGQVSADVQAFVGGILVLGEDCVWGIDAPGALLPHAVEGRIAAISHPGQSGAGQAHLDLVRAQVGALGNYQGCHTRNCGGSLRGTGQLEVISIQRIAGVFSRQVGIRRDDRDHVRARGNQVGLAKAIQGRAGGGERGDVVVAPISGSVVISKGADCHNVGVVTRDRDGHGA